MWTWSGRIVPPLFSATNSRRFDDEKPKVASRANSVSPTGSTLAPDPRPVHVAGGEAAGLQVGRDQQHPVVASPEHLTTYRVQCRHLGDEVPAQRGVAAADHLDGRVQPPAQLEQGAADPGVERHRVGLAHAAGVGEDEAGATRPVEPGGDLVGVEHGHDRHVVDRLGSGGVVVQHGDPAAGVDQGLADPLPRLRLHPHRRQGGRVGSWVRHGVPIPSLGTPPSCTCTDPPSRRPARRAAGSRRRTSGGPWHLHDHDRVDRRKDDARTGLPRPPRHRCRGPRPTPSPARTRCCSRITATGICGSDLHGYTGENKRRHPGQIMGHETVGRIVAVGSDVSDERLGLGRLATVNPVIGCGECAQCAAGTEQLCPRRTVIGVDKEIESAFAELMLAPAAQRRRAARRHTRGVRRPDRAARRRLPRGASAAGSAPDDAVLVIGGGPIGQAAALAARRLDAERVVVSEPNPARRALVEKLGFATIDPTAGDLAEQVQDAYSAARRPPCSTPSAAAGRVGDGLPRRPRSAPASSWSGWGPASSPSPPSTSAPSNAVDHRHRSPTRRGTSARRRSGSPRAPTGCSTSIDDRVGLDDAPDAFARLASGDLDASKIMVFPHGADAEEAP